MLKNIISQGNYALWSQIATVFFFLIFLSVLIWVFRKRSDAYYQYMSQLPQEGESERRGDRQ